MKGKVVLLLAESYISVLSYINFTGVDGSNYGGLVAGHHLDLLSTSWIENMIPFTHCVKMRLISRLYVDMIEPDDIYTFLWSSTI